MVKLSDIAPAQKRVLIPTGDGEAEVDVRGLSVTDIRDLLERFPEVAGLLDQNVNVALLLKLGPKFVAAVIAMACGSANDKDVEAAVEQFALGTQVEIMTIVVEQTMPRGVAPFVKLLKAAGLELGTARKA